MNGTNFDALTLAIGRLTSRRAILRALTGGALAIHAGHLGRETAGAARRCLKQGKDCKRDNQCCSGLCTHRKCRQAPGQANCTIRRNFCAADPEVFICNDNPPCRCYVTTRRTSFCGINGDGQCAPCATNADCETVTGPGSACVQGGSGGCCGGGTACFPPCPDPD